MSRTSDRVYQRRRARLRREPDGDICHACRLPIDMDLKWPHSLSWTADHIDPVGKALSAMVIGEQICRQPFLLKRHVVMVVTMPNVTSLKAVSRVREEIVAPTHRDKGFLDRDCYFSHCESNNGVYLVVLVFIRDQPLSPFLPRHGLVAI